MLLPPRSRYDCPELCGKAVSTYTVQIAHDDDGDFNVTVTDAGSSESDRASIAWALREAAQLVEDGLPIARDMMS